MAEEIETQLDEEFLPEVDGLIQQIVESENINLQSEAGNAILQYYQKNLVQVAPNSVSTNQNYVSCKMDERVTVETEQVDCVRYLEGFLSCFEFKNVDLPVITTNLVSNAVSGLALALADVFERLYISPILQISLRKEHELRQSFFAQESQSATQTIKIELSELEKAQIAECNDFLEHYARDLEEYEENELTSNNDILLRVRQASDGLCVSSIKQPITSSVGIRGLIDYLIQEDASEQISSQEFRKIRANYLDTLKRSGVSGEEQKFNAKYLCIEVLAAIVASVKVVEEKYPLIVNTKIGEIEETKFKSWAWSMLDEAGVLLKGLRDIYM